MPLVPLVYSLVELDRWLPGQLDDLPRLLDRLVAVADDAVGGDGGDGGGGGDLLAVDPVHVPRRLAPEGLLDPLPDGLASAAVPA